MADIREHFMDTYDDNKDGKIEIREVINGPNFKSLSLNSFD